MDLPNDSLQNKDSNSKGNSKFPFKKSLIILSISLLLVLVISSSYYNVNTGAFSIKFPFSKNEAISNESGFNEDNSNLNLSDLGNTSGEDSKTAFGSLVSKDEGLTQQSLTNDFLAFKEMMLTGISDELWSWENDFTHTQVYEVDKENNIIYVDFMIPGDGRFSLSEGEEENEKHNTVKVSCSDEFTFIVDPSNLEITETGVNLFDNLTPEKDSLLFKCSNAVCTETRKACLILKGVDADTNDTNVE